MYRFLTLPILALSLFATGCATQIMHNPKALDAGEVHASLEAHSPVHGSLIRGGVQAGVGIGGGVELHGAAGLAPHIETEANIPGPHDFSSLFYGGGLGVNLWQDNDKTRLKLSADYLRDTGTYMIQPFQILWAPQPTPTRRATHQLQTTALFHFIHGSLITPYVAGGLLSSHQTITQPRYTLHEEDEPQEPVELRTSTYFTHAAHLALGVQGYIVPDRVALQVEGSGRIPLYGNNKRARGHEAFTEAYQLNIGLALYFDMF